MPWTFNPFSGTFDQKGSGGGGGASYIDGEVQNFSALPTANPPAVDSAYLVREPEGTWLINRKPAGIYIRVATTGTRATDWTYAGILPDVFNDANFLLYDNGDSSKNLAFQLSGITTGTTRTLTVPDASGTIARTEDFAAPPAIGNTTPAAGTFTTLSAAPTSGSALTLTGGTVTASAPLIDATQTWNNAAVAFAGLRINITNTASLANDSSYAEFQTGGVMRYLFAQSGRLSVNGASGGEPNFRAKITTDTVYRFQVGLASNNEAQIEMGAGGGSARDTFLNRDAAGVFAQRNAANPQTFNIYNTHSSSTNHERGFLKWSSNVFQIGTEKGSGGGTARALELQTDGATRFTIATNGAITCSSSLSVTSQIVFQGNANIAGNIGGGIIRLNNHLSTGFDRLQFGGGTTSFPALKRDSTVLQARLANDSGFCPLQGQLRIHQNAVSETITATHTLTLFDAAGTAYKVPCVAA